jgi:peptidoglycan/LPS O-acetylase OafA/YrhL
MFWKFIYHIDYIIVTLITSGLIFISNYVHSHKNFFSTLGQHSYSVYLIHVPIGVFILSLFENSYISQNPLLNFIYDLTVYFFISVLAWFMFNWVEKPSITYGRKLSKKYFNGNLKKHTD